MTSERRQIVVAQGRGQVLQIAANTAYETKTVLAVLCQWIATKLVVSPRPIFRLAGRGNLTVCYRTMDGPYYEQLLRFGELPTALNHMPF
jgi:hypothetical protein